MSRGSIECAKQLLSTGAEIKKDENGDYGLCAIGKGNEAYWRRVHTVTPIELAAIVLEPESAHANV